MPINVNSFISGKAEERKEKTIEITIALEEYRSLVEENARLDERVIYLENRLLEEQIKNRGADNG